MIVFRRSGPERDFDARLFVTGMALHLVTSAGMGAFYGFALHPFVTGRGVLAEAAVVLGYVLVSWAVYQYLLMPWLAPVMDAHTDPFWLAVAHVVYGASLLAWASLFA
jgi:hypothetical protein